MGDRLRHKDSRRIVMLVPHEPTLDPRVGWVGDLCRTLAPTHTISVVHDLDSPSRETDGRHCTDRIPLSDAAGWRSKFLSKAAGGLQRLVGGSKFADFRRRELDDDFAPVGGERPTARPRSPLRLLQSRVRFANSAAKAWRLADSLRRAVREVVESPSLVVCHDIYGLPAALDLKRRHGCAVVYDSHEYWPEADLLGEPWSRNYWSHVEGALARQADAVVTVSPPLADRLRREYGLRSVHCVPNWTPYENAVRWERRLGEPVKFLLQGSAAPGRGFEMLLHTWSLANDPRAELYLRCPEWEYLADLRRAYADADRGIHFLPAVAEESLVSEAAFADVGVIPYPRNNANHLMCCPNKLSQYLQAGVPVLATDTIFVGERIRDWKCGWTYNAFKGESLAAKIRAISRDEVGLRRAKEAAVRAGRTECNWESVVGDYARLLTQISGIRQRSTRLVPLSAAA